ncbi:AMP-binding domain-containing protein [Meloidogyne graminicola]|uniref:long-chain-fatty-acid--CoA ligase n=1 Tax=Meloidogyne graminicola TaxID=189291 RepID=A0A8S9ZV84_9BILA|nr:AMP-binding domain-containing protein [Meloidogyne graminicola]
MEGIEQYAIELTNSPGTFKSALLKDRQEETLEYYFPEVKTLWNAFQRGLKLTPDGRCLGVRTKEGSYKFISYEQVAKQSKNIGIALISCLGLLPGQQTFVAIYASNCPEWGILALALIRHSMILIPLYDTLGEDSASYILAHVGAELVMLDSIKKLQNVFNMNEKTPLIKNIIYVGILEEEKIQEVKKKANELNINLYFWNDLINNIEENKTQNEETQEEVKDNEPKPEDTYIICYTSGTTGKPKGVILSHRNVVANISALAIVLEKIFIDNGTLYYFMYVLLYFYIEYNLPLSHMFEQCAMWIAFCLGYRIGYVSDGIATLSADMQALEPTLLPVVPRLLNRFNDSIKAEVSNLNPFSRWLFNIARAQKKALLQKGIVTCDSLWDKLVFSKARQRIGGHVRLIVTGSAPISAEVLEELRIVFGCHIIEGYGQTECTAMATSTWPGDTIGGQCGGPSTCSLIKLEDAPDLNYFVKDRKGEVLIKGPSVTSGYFRDPEKTEELFTKDGFLKTGDIGHLLPNGQLQIIDRRKHIFKLAQGEYVAPEKIENVYIQCSMVHQVFVDGDSLQRFLVAIVVPSSGQIKRHFAQINGKTENGNNKLEEICSDKRIINFVLKEMQQIGKEQNLNSLEQVKAIYLEPEPFTIENDLLTPTLKAKRPQLRAKYKETISQLYSETHSEK